MKLLLPALRPAEPNPRHEAIAAQTSELLLAIDALLAYDQGPADDQGPAGGPRGAEEPVGQGGREVRRQGRLNALAARQGPANARQAL